MAVLAFNQDGDTLWGTKTQLKDDIPPARLTTSERMALERRRRFLFRWMRQFSAFVFRDNYSGRVGSMEVRLPLAQDGQESTGAD